MALSVKIGTTTSDPRVIDKQTSLGEAVSCKVIHADDVAHPTIELDYKDTYDGCNYMQIEEFHRYYYIESITMSSATTCTIVGHSDPLMSFAAEIKALTCNIYRNEGTGMSAYNDKTDDEYPLLAGDEIVYKSLGFQSSSELEMITYGTQNPGSIPAFVMIKANL